LPRLVWSDDVRQHQQNNDHQRHPEQPQNNRHISLQALIRRHRLAEQRMFGIEVPKMAGSSWRLATPLGADRRRQTRKYDPVCPTARAIAVGCARTIWRPCAMGRLPRDDGAELSNLRNERRRRDSIRRFECRAALTIVRPTTAGSCEYGKGGPAYPRSLPPSATRSLNFKNVRHSALFIWCDEAP
jgi:hypothetical protein